MGFVAAAIATAVVLFYLVMTESGHWLVSDDDFDHVKWVVILDGQSADLERSDFAANLVLQGKADSVVILGRRVFRDKSNAEFYADDFMQSGNFDSNAVFISSHDDPSTLSEALTVIPWLKKHKADTVLLLTSASATRRVKRIFNVLSGEHPVYLTTDIHHYHYNADSWYADRESSKNWLREWAALAVSYYDLWNVDSITVADSTFYKPIVSVKEFEAQKNPVVDLQSLLPKVKDKIEEAVRDSIPENSNDSTLTDSAKADSTKK